MFDEFLSSTLKIIIALDIIGVIAYFSLGAFKAHKHKQPLLATAPKSRRWWRRSPRSIATESAESLQEACSTLKRVLYSYERGLA